MKKVSIAFFSSVLLSSLYAQSDTDSVYINDDLFLRRDVSRELDIVAAHIDTNVQAHHHEQWAYYLNRAHPAVVTVERYFNEAAVEFSVPLQIVKAIGQVENNWTQTGPSIDRGWGIMHLVQNDYCNTLNEAAQLLHVSETDLKEDAQLNIRGAAALLRKYFDEDITLLDENLVEDWYNAVKKFSGLISDELRSLQADRYYGVMRDGSRSTTLWNEEIVLERNKMIDMDYIRSRFPSSPNPGNGNRSADYGPAISNFTTCNYTTGRNHSIDTWVNHWIGTGTALGAVSWFQNCSANASAHFVTANNGTIYQVVGVANTAWHCGASGYPYNNSRSIGQEHEATNANPTLWNSTAMLQASAQMACHFCDLYNIPTNQNQTSPGICGHQDMPGTNTDCPGNIPWSTWFTYFNTGNCNAQPVVPPNDYCGNEIGLTVYGQTCGAVTTGDLNGATQSTAPTACDGYTSSNAYDVWFTFVATATSHDITVVPSGGLDAVVDLRTGCPGTSVNCEDAGGGEGSTEVLHATGLTIGNTYRVRVYDYTGVGNPATTTTFTICVTTPCTQPVKPVITGTSSICSGQSATLTVSNPCSGCSFSWSNGGSGTQASVTTSGNYRVTATNACGSSASDPFTVTVNQTPQPVISNLSNAYCLASSNATLSATPSGGTFSGNGISGNVFSPSSAGTGTHTITYTVTQSGCTGSVSQQTTVSTNPSVQITAGSVISFCSGGSVVLTATQGSSYVWSNGATSQSVTVTQPGSYNVTVTNPGGCNASVGAMSPVVVTVYPNPVAAAGADQTLVTLPGNSVVIGGSPTANGGTSPYSYQWSPATGLSFSTVANPVVSDITSPVTYTVIVTDANGCTATDDVTVNTALPCNYHITPNYALVSAAGGIDSFFVDVSDTGCVAWDIISCSGVTILSPALPHSGDGMVVYWVDTNTATSSRVCSMDVTGGENFLLVQYGSVLPDPCNPPPVAPVVQLNNCELAAGFVPNVSYQWFRDSSLVSGATSRFYSASLSGYYYVIIADSNFCTAQSQDVYVSYPACLATGVSEVNHDLSFVVFEMGVGSWKLEVGRNFIGGEVEVFDVIGNVVFASVIGHRSSVINSSAFAKGVYLVQVESRDGLGLVRKVVKM